MDEQKKTDLRSSQATIDYDSCLVEFQTGKLEKGKQQASGEICMLA